MRPGEEYFFSPDFGTLRVAPEQMRLGLVAMMFFHLKLSTTEDTCLRYSLKGWWEPEWAGWVSSEWGYYVLGSGIRCLFFSEGSLKKYYVSDFEEPDIQKDVQAMYGLLGIKRKDSYPIMTRVGFKTKTTNRVKKKRGTATLFYESRVIRE